MLYARLLDRFLVRRGLLLGHGDCGDVSFGNSSSGLILLLRCSEEDDNGDDAEEECEPWNVGNEFDWRGQTGSAILRTYERITGKGD